MEVCGINVDNVITARSYASAVGLYVVAYYDNTSVCLSVLRSLQFGLSESIKMTNSAVRLNIIISTQTMLRGSQVI